MTEHQISAGKAAATSGTLVWLFVGMGTLVTFQVFQASKRPSTNGADMRTRLVGSNLERFLRYGLRGARVQQGASSFVFGRDVGKHVSTSRKKSGRKAADTLDDKRNLIRSLVKRRIWQEVREFSECTFGGSGTGNTRTQTMVLEVTSDSREKVTSWQ